MKKVFTIIVALMLSSIGLYAFEKVQLEKFQTLQINELKKGPSLKKAKLSFNQPKVTMVKGQKVAKVRNQFARRNAATAKTFAKASENTVVTIGVFYASTAYEGEYYVMMTDAASSTQFIFDIVTDSLVLGKTYTMADMIAEYTGIGDAEDYYAWTEVKDATYKETKDEKGLTHVVASMTDAKGTVYNITYDQQEPQSYSIAASDFGMTDYGTDMYIVLTDDNGNLFYFDVYYADAFEFDKTYTLSDMDPDYSWYKLANGGGYSYKEASIKVSKDQDGLHHITAAVVLDNGDSYTITYDEKPFAPSGVKINLDGTDLYGRYNSYYEMYAYTATCGDCEVQLAFDVTEEKAKYTNDDMIPEFCVYYSDDYSTFVEFVKLASDITITNEDGKKTLSGSIYAKNGDEYVLNLVYEKPDVKEISVVVTDATLNNKTAAGFWIIGGKNADKTQDINLYFKTKGLQGTFTEKEMYDYNTWLDDSSTGSKVTYENLSAANLVSTIVGDSLVIEGTLSLADSKGNPANVTVHISTPFKQEWGEWADFAPFGVNTGKYVFSSFFTSPQTQRNIPVQERKDNTGMKQYKLSGWGAGLLTADGVDLIINRDANNNLTVPEVYIGYKTSGFEVWTTDAYSFSGGAEAQGKYDPETGVFKMNMVSFLPEYDDYNWGASEESLTMDQVITKRDTVDIVSTKLGYNDSYLESDKIVIYYDQSIEGYQVFRVTSNNATSVDGTFKWSEGGINNANSYFQLTGSSTKSYFQDGEFTVVTEGKNIALTGWMIGNDEKYYRLNMSYVAPTERDTVSFSGKGIAISKVTDDTTGEHTGWFYEFGADGYEFLLQSTVPAEKFGTFSYEDKTLGKQYYNVFDPEGGRQQFKEGSITVAEAGDSIVLDGQLIAEDEKVYILHFAKSTIKDTIKVEAVSYENMYFSSESDAYYVLNAPNYTFYYDIFVSPELQDAENGVEYTLDNMYADYCSVTDSINGTSLPMEEASFIKNEKDSLLFIDAKAVTSDAVYIISYVGKKKVVEPKKDFAIDFPAECLSIDDYYFASYGDITVTAEDAAGNVITLDLYDYQYADGVITPGVYSFDVSGGDKTVYPGELFYGIFPMPSYATDASGNYWFLVSGTVTVTANSIVIDAVDDEGFSVKSTISFSTPTGIGSIKSDEYNKVMKFFDGKKIVIRKGDKKYNVNGLEF